MTSYDQYQAARQLMAQGQYEEATHWLQRSIETDPHFKALESLGECLIHLNRWPEAVVPLAAATTLNRGVRAPSLLAGLFLAVGQKRDADAMADLALSRDSKNRKALLVKEQVVKDS